MKFITVAVVLCAFACMAFADETTTPEPEMCSIVCPKPLPDDQVLMPAPGDCTSYCQCDPRGAILQHCAVYDKETGARLHFNPVTKVCDWPDVAGCE